MYRVHVSATQVLECVDRHDAAALARQKKCTVERDGVRWRPLHHGGWERLDIWRALAGAGVAAALDSNPARVAMMLELLSRPWGSLPPPWFFCAGDGAGYEHQYERLRDEAIQRGQLPGAAAHAALEGVVKTMKMAGDWPPWMTLKMYHDNRARLARRLGLD